MRPPRFRTKDVSILTGERYHGALVPLAAKLLVAGMKDGAAVNLLLRCWSGRV
jgi:hypothetical protein